MNSPTIDGLPEPGSLAKIILKPGEEIIVYTAIKKALLRSFAEDAHNALIQLPTHFDPPQSAIRERFNICVEWFLLARLELGFTLDRTIAKLPLYLRNKLDKIPMAPDTWGERGYFAD